MGRNYQFEVTGKLSPLETPLLQSAPPDEEE